MSTACLVERRRLRGRSRARRSQYRGPTNWRQPTTPSTYNAERTALLIVDPYNDFLSEGGKLYEATRETAEAVGFYGNMRKLIPAIRAARIEVIIVPHHRWRESDYKGWKHMNPTQLKGNAMQG